MALSDDQRAMLRLLAQREQGYEDMAALMGVSVEELRGRVREALSELEKEGKEAPPLPPDPPAAAAPQQAEPEPPKVEPEPPKEPTAPPPSSEPPEAPPTAQPAAPPPPPPPSPKPKRGFSLPSSNGARIGIAAVAAAIVVVVVLLIVLGGGSGSPSTTTSGTTTTANSEAASGGVVQEAAEAAAKGSGKKEVTEAVLTGVEGSEANGIAIFGRVKNKLALQIVAEGLEPLASGQSYAIWIAASPTRMLPLAASSANKKGQIASQFEVPTEILSYLANETFNEIAITRTSNSRLNASLKAATKAKEAPAYTGAAIMRGTITGPIIGAAKRQEQEKAKGK